MDWQFHAPPGPAQRAHTRHVWKKPTHSSTSPLNQPHANAEVSTKVQPDFEKNETTLSRRLGGEQEEVCAVSATPARRSQGSAERAHLPVPIHPHITSRDAVSRRGREREGFH